MEEIYRAHFGFVWAVLRRLGVPDRDLEDVAQDVFVVVHRRLAEFEGRAATRTWLYAIAVRVAWNHARRRRLREPAASTVEAVAPPRTSDPEEHALRTQAGRMLDGVLARLDDDKRAVFVLSDIEGLTANEIAQIVGTNPRTVYSRLRVARERVHGDLRRLHAREQSAAERRRWLRAATSGDGPPPPAERRVWAALASRLPTDAAALTATAGGVGWPAVVQAVTVSLALGVAGLGAVWVAAAPLRDDAPEAGEVRVRDPGDGGAAVRTLRGAPTLVEDTSVPEAIDVRAAAPPLDDVADSRSRPRRRAQPSREDAPTPPEPDALLAELPLLERARDALARDDARAALRELAEHERRFPRSALAIDRQRLQARARDRARSP